MATQIWKPKNSAVFFLRVFIIIVHRTSCQQFANEVNGFYEALVDFVKIPHTNGEQKFQKREWTTKQSISFYDVGGGGVQKVSAQDCEKKVRKANEWNTEQIIVTILTAIPS